MGDVVVRCEQCGTADRELTLTEHGDLCQVCVHRQAERDDIYCAGISMSTLGFLSEDE